MNQSIAPLIAGVMPAALATGLFVSFCNVQAPDGQYGPSGAPSGVYATVTGLGAIRCMDAPKSTPQIEAGEKKTIEEVDATAFRHVALDDYYPAIITGWRQGWRAIVTGPDGTFRTYDLLGAEADSQETQTRLSLQLVTL